MKIIKRIPFQIFILNLAVSIICIVGMLIMRNNLNEIVDSYEQKIEKSMDDRLTMSDIRRMMNRNHMIVLLHTLADNDAARAAYEEETAQLKATIMSQLDKMKAGTSANENEQLFHTVYSNTISYFNDVENVFQISAAGNGATVSYYVNSYLAELINDITEDIVTMDKYLDGKMGEAQKKMVQCIGIAKASEVLCIVFICVVLIVSMVICIGITSKLENYKNLLEEENERKTQALTEHNRRMLLLQENTIIGMAAMIENRDNDTGEHVKRTSRYVELLTRTARNEGYCTEILTDDYAELLVKAAPMHDIGKIAVSDAILQKPGRLTPEEFDAMKEHTTAGGRIIAEVMGGIVEKEYIDIAVQIAEGHHEKWDGSGYPKGVKGNDIPLCARIMAVADVFDALVSKRCYKEAMPVDKAFSIIEESGGSHFDPNLSRLFCGIRDEITEMLGKF